MDLDLYMDKHLCSAFPPADLNDLTLNVSLNVCLLLVRQTERGHHKYS